MRTKLKKYLGKQLRYVGTIAKLQDDNALLLNITLDGKKITDHQFIGLTRSNNTLMGEGLTYSFFGTATSYNRSDGTRDYKLGRVHSFRNVTIFEVEEDARQSQKRRSIR